MLFIETGQLDGIKCMIRTYFGSDEMTCEQKNASRAHAAKHHEPAVCSIAVHVVALPSENRLLK